MNDPGTADPINEANKDLKRIKDGDGAMDDDEIHNFVDPRYVNTGIGLTIQSTIIRLYSRWWFASTAAPLFSGTFGPIANGLSICALVSPWRLYIPPGNTEAQGSPMPDPKWLIIINSISLALAIAANIALLLNMARRLSFGIAQPLSIIGFYLSGFLLIALVIVAGSESSGFRLDLPPEQHALSQAYYYAILAAIIYVIIATLSISTIVGAIRGRYAKEFSLTTAQRTLMLQTILFMGYLLIGAAVFSHIERWQYSDGVFFASFTLLTIGLGSPFAPTTVLGRGLLFPFGIGGILTIGLVIGSVRSLALERGKKKLQARFVEKKRESTIDSINPKNRTITVSWFRRYEFSEDGMTEPQKREQEFIIMRKIQQEASNRQKYIGLAFSILSTLILWLVGAAIFLACESQQGWDYFTALYFSYTTLLTIGYGDEQPVSNSGKPFFVLWTMLAVPTLTILISNLGSTVVKAFANLAIWAGNLTILPEGNRPHKHFRKSARNVVHALSLNPRNPQIQQPPGFLPYPEEDKDGDGAIDPPSDESSRKKIHTHALNRLANHVEDEEISAALAEDDNDLAARDRKLYLYVLVRELRALMDDMLVEPDKQYSYADWAWYLRLLDMDESDESIHRNPKGQGSADISAKEDIKKELGMRDDKKKPWSWLGIRSPLLSSMKEPQWLVSRIGHKLEAEMRRASQNSPPISLGDLMKRRQEEKVEEDKEEKMDEQEEKAAESSSKT